jgi:hypothetical protein
MQCLCEKGAIILVSLQDVAMILWEKRLWQGVTLAESQVIILFDSQIVHRMMRDKEHVRQDRNRRHYLMTMDDDERSDALNPRPK